MKPSITSKNKITFPVILIITTLLPSFMTSSKFTDPFVHPKFFYLYFFSMFFLTIFFLWNYIRKYKTVLHITILDAGIFSYLAYQMLRILTTPHVHVGSDSFLVLMISGILYFCIKPWMKANERNRNTLIALFGAITLISLGQVIYGFLELGQLIPVHQKEFSIGGAQGNPGPYSNFLAALVPFPLALILFRYPKSKTLKFLGWLTLAAVAVILPFTRARAGWIATCIGTVFMIYHHFNLKGLIQKWFRQAWIKAIAIVCFIAIILPAGIYLYKFKEDSASGRLFVWKITTQMIQDKPLFGVGYDMFPAVHNAYQADYFIAHQNSPKEAQLADTVNYAFNEYLQICAETGLTGLSLFLFIFYLVFFRQKKTGGDGEIKGVFSLAAKTSLLVVFITSLFSYPLRVVPSNVLFILLLSFVSANNSMNIFSVTFLQRQRRLLSFLGLAIIFLFSLYQYKIYKASTDWQKAFHAVRRKDYKKAMGMYENLYPLMRHNPLFLFNYGAEMSLIGQYQKSIDILQDATHTLGDSDNYIYLGNSYEGIGEFEKAIQCFLKASWIMPVKFYPKYRIVKLYLKQGKNREAKLLATEIIKMPVKVPSKIIDGIKKEMQSVVKNL